MSFFNGFDMADFGAFDDGYSWGSRKGRKRRKQKFDPWKTRSGQLASHMRCNIARGEWFTGVKFADMTDAHLANALALSERKFYLPYVDALTEEIERRKAVDE